MTHPVEDKEQFPYLELNELKVGEVAWCAVARNIPTYTKPITKDPTPFMMGTDGRMHKILSDKTPSALPIPAYFNTFFSDEGDCWEYYRKSLLPKLYNELTTHIKKLTDFQHSIKVQLP